MASTVREFKTVDILKAHKFQGIEYWETNNDQMFTQKEIRYKDSVQY